MMGQMMTWLRDPNPASRMQARLGQYYLGWLRLRRNPLAVVGLTIVLALLAMAALAPVLATHRSLCPRPWSPPAAAADPGQLVGHR